VLPQAPLENAMHILIAIFGLLAAAAFWWWRIKAVGEAANDVTDAAGRVWGKYKRRKFLNKVEDSPLAVIDDPATAAVILMYAVVAEDVGLGPDVEATIRKEVIETMQIDDPTEIITFGKWTAGHATDANNIIHRYGKIWQDNLNSKERLELVDMIARITPKDSKGELNLIQKTRIGKLRQRLGFPV
jgi:hypothetical protein